MWHLKGWTSLVPMRMPSNAFYFVRREQKKKENPIFEMGIVNIAFASCFDKQMSSVLTWNRITYILVSIFCCSSSLFSVNPFCSFLSLRGDQSFEKKFLTHSKTTKNDVMMIVVAGTLCWQSLLLQQFLLNLRTKPDNSGNVIKLFNLNFHKCKAVSVKL